MSAVVSGHSISLHLLHSLHLFKIHLSFHRKCTVSAPWMQTLSFRINLEKHLQIIFVYFLVQQKHVVRRRKKMYALAQHSHGKQTAGSRAKVQGLLDPSTSPPIHHRVIFQLLTLRC